MDLNFVSKFASFRSRLRSEFAERFDFGYAKFRWFRENRAIENYLRSLSQMQKVPRFSVIIPTYGIAPRYIQECFESLLQQTYGNWELCICIDADPIAESVEFVRRFASQHPHKVRLIENERNLGICIATRRALTLASGDFAVFVDADDLLHRRALEIIARRLNDNPNLDFVYTNHDYLTDWGWRKHPMIKPGWSPETLLHVNYINHLKVVRMSLLKSLENEIFPPESNGSQDWDLCLKMILHADQIGHIPLYLYHWRMRPGSIATHHMEKPWAVATQIQVRQQFIGNLNPALRLEPSMNIYQLMTEKHFEMKEIIVELPMKTKSYFDVIRWLETEAEKASDHTILFFSLHDDHYSNEEMQFLAAYAVMPQIAAVWPAQALGLRTSYTVGQGVLVPTLHARSSYSQYSGNVLTGPLNGLAIEASKLKKIVTEMHQFKDFFGDNLMKDLNILGAWIGLSALHMQMRNVSILNVTRNQNLALLKFPDDFLPPTDPYL